MYMEVSTSLEMEILKTMGGKMSNINISGVTGGNNIFGDNNIQNNVLTKNTSEQILRDIEQSNLSLKEKEEAKSLVRQLLSSPVCKFVLTLFKKHSDE